jgi:hypothetical protein
LAAEYSIRKIEHRQARKPYACQCGQEDCYEFIAINEEYALFKVVEKLQGSYKNIEKHISHHCEWYKHWIQFLK